MGPPINGMSGNRDKIAIISRHQKNDKKYPVHFGVGKNCVKVVLAQELATSSNMNVNKQTAYATANSSSIVIEKNWYCVR